MTVITFISEICLYLFAKIVFKYHSDISNQDSLKDVGNSLNLQIH